MRTICIRAGFHARPQKNINTKEPNMDITKMNISVCGYDCHACKFFKDKECAGCRIAAPLNKCVWGGGCDLHNCATSKGFNHCGQCPDFPCEMLVTAMTNESGEQGREKAFDNLRNFDSRNGKLPSLPTL